MQHQIHFGFRPDPTSMTMDDALDECKSHSRSREFFLGVQPLEDAEQFVRVAHVEARAVVLHVVDDFAVLARSRADLDFPGIALCG